MRSIVDRGTTVVMTQVVEMYLLHGGTPRDQQARAELLEQLPGAEATEADDVGVFEIELDADDKEAALTRIWDAVAASGTDDHIVFLEHADIPEHWRERSGAVQPERTAVEIIRRTGNGVFAAHEAAPS